MESISFTQKGNNEGTLVIKINGFSHTWDGDTSSFEYSYRGWRDNHDEYDGPYLQTRKFRGPYQFNIQTNDKKGKDDFIAFGDGFLRSNDEGSPGSEVKLARAKWMITSAVSLAKGPSNEERELIAKENR